jgi:hypothetical protein
MSSENEPSQRCKYLQYLTVTKIATFAYGLSNAQAAGAAGAPPRAP